MSFHTFKITNHLLVILRKLRKELSRRIFQHRLSRKQLPLLTLVWNYALENFSHRLVLPEAGGEGQAALLGAKDRVRLANKGGFGFWVGIKLQAMHDNIHQTGSFPQGRGLNSQLINFCFPSCSSLT